MTQWIIRSDAPFAGFVQTHIRDDGFVAYADGNLTPEQYGLERGFPVRVVDDAELDEMLETWTAQQITEPAEETLAEFTYALECLPPCRWRRHRGVEMFHISEGVTHDLVQWHVAIGERCFTFVDRRSAPTEAIAAKAAAAIGAQ
ncbi:hypothetical protein SAMN06265338_12624 [Rhodoblastus acidophilus]|uniref:Uncharacterized protein n=1 Tax=Rhodoblastus acidophilus TaxID=1074 RepID=A0A212SCW4_RHOAC|nr:hypothetical protein [Rhodoblastus acidophilus]PPQ35573.1 hypothetical protein CKO16_20230 [Rhodoblastus acidophilus]RAI17002.1 hypothetical protein CH337_18500 [Rhodoblastus acidophilus]SNB83410.1 hypothetical protein SAMN06265338_12624 [Rhodoblastus acidophilus]